MAAEFRLLGDLVVTIDGRPVDIGHARQRCVLAALLVDANQVVTADQLVDRVWGGQPPRGARQALYSYVSRLRRSLAPVEDVRLVRRSGGYAVLVDPMMIDLYRFRRLIEQAQRADEESALRLWESALALWRGPALAHLDTLWVETCREAWERERLAAEYERTDLALRCGRHASLVPELTRRADAQPLDERLAAALMLALDRCGRRGEALAHYHRVRRRLVEELGTDPGPELQRLHVRLLRGETVPVTGASAEAPAPATRMHLPRQLPAPPPLFTGRASELAELDAALLPSARQPGAMPISTIGGAGGVGKTWLALRWAHDNIDRFPDGQLFVNLRGFDPSAEPTSPSAALRTLLQALGIPPATVPTELDAQAGVYRSLVAGRRMLVLLDNAHDSDQVTPLLPGSATCTVLITSRRRMSGLVAANGAQPLALDMLAETEARRLLERLLGAHRTRREPDSVTAIVDHCGGLPLALSVMAARAATHPDLPLAVLTEDLREQLAPLDAFGAEDLTTDLRAVFGASYRALRPDTARLFGLLGLAPGPDLSLTAAATLARVPVGRVRMLLRELHDAHLVHQHTPRRYRMHDLVRLYAAERAHHDCPPQARQDALRGLLDYYVHTAHAADLLLYPYRDRIELVAPRDQMLVERLNGAEDALAWFDEEQPGLVAAVRQAADAGFPRHVQQLAASVAEHFHRRGHWQDLVTVQRAALDTVLRVGGPQDQARAHRSLARAYSRLNTHDAARRHLGQAAELFEQLGDRVGLAHTQLSFAFVCEQQHRYADALRHSRRALDLYRSADHRAGQANALNTVGWYHTLLGDHQQALIYCQQALTAQQALGSRPGEAATWDSLGHAHHHAGDHRRALECYQRALDLVGETGDRHHEARVLSAMAEIHQLMADPEAARVALRRALTIFEDLSHPDTGVIADRLRELGG